MIERSTAFEAVLGGYYAYKSPADADAWSIMRLLDVNEALHYSLYNTTFNSLPTIEEITATVPFIQHIPQDIGTVFNWSNITLIAEKPLEDKDLEGYSAYLEHGTGLSKEDIENYLIKIKSYSNKHFKVIVSEKDGEVTVRSEPIS